MNIRFSTPAKLMQASLLVIALAGCAATPTKESTGQVVDDSVITTRVKTDLFADKGVKGHEVKVDTFKGIVQLSGFVSSQEEADKAGRIARSISGVQGVKNDIVVK